MKIHRSIQGEMVDQICADHYGDTAMTEAVYEANPGLAALGPVLPRGTLIKLPAAPAPAPRQIVRLWGK